LQDWTTQSSCAYNRDFRILQPQLTYKSLSACRP
jgi:hypothetical protein